MKRILIIILLFATFTGLFAQRVDYLISAGSNYTKFPYFLNSPENSNRYYYENFMIGVYIYPGLNNYDSEFKWGIGYLLNNNISVNLLKRMSIKTGFGISLNRSNTNLLIEGDGGYSFYDSVWHDPYRIESNNINDIVLLNIPAKLNIKLFKDKLQLNTGVSISSVIFARRKEIIISENETNIYYLKSELVPNFLNIEFGTEYLIFNNMFIGLSFKKNLTAVHVISSFNLYSFSVYLSYKI